MLKVKRDIRSGTLSSPFHPDSYTISPHLHSDIIAIKKPPRSESRGTRLHIYSRAPSPNSSFLVHPNVLPNCKEYFSS